MQQQQNITVQLIDAAGRSLGRLSLPSSISLADLERLASPSLSAHLEQHVAAKARQLAKEAGL